jgi:hypothetical protein
MYCQKPGCDRSWPRDPALEVRMPRLSSKIGSPCKRPSGHSLFAHGVHAARDLAVDAVGKYGICPTARCGLTRKAAEPVQADLFGLFLSVLAIRPDAAISSRRPIGRC